jgi:hypothetical protein
LQDHFAKISAVEVKETEQAPAEEKEEKKKKSKKK